MEKFIEVTPLGIAAIHINSRYIVSVESVKGQTYLRVESIAFDSYLIIEESVEEVLERLGQ